MNFEGPHPSFERPPVREVVASVAFDRKNLTTGHLGEFWTERLRADLPDLEEQPPYQPPVESPTRLGPMFLQLELMEALKSNRLWAKSADGARLVQVQPDWFAVNWRGAPGADGPYLRWPSIESMFLEQFASLEAFVKGAGLGPIAARQCEVTYVNEISASGGDLHGVLSGIGPSPPLLGAPETMQLAATYPLTDPTGVWRGRLHITAQPGVRRSDTTPVFVLDLTARLSTLGQDVASTLEALRLGHVWVVNAFASITTTQMHDEWGRTA